jgi:hypothetical protein
MRRGSATLEANQARRKLQKEARKLSAENKSVADEAKKALARLQLERETKAKTERLLLEAAEKLRWGKMERMRESGQDRRVYTDWAETPEKGNEDLGDGGQWDEHGLFGMELPEGANIHPADDILAGLDMQTIQNRRMESFADKERPHLSSGIISHASLRTYWEKYRAFRQNRPHALLSDGFTKDQLEQLETGIQYSVYVQTKWPKERAMYREYVSTLLTGKTDFRSDCCVSIYSPLIM